MDSNRKNIIMNEILYWKENKLLPEQYCNFLLTLYSQGDQEYEVEKIKVKNNKNYLLLMLICLVPITFLVIYFTELSFVLQMLIFALFILICVWFAYKFYQFELFIHIPIVVASLILLLASIHIVERFFPNQSYLLAGTIAINCGMWIYTGKKLKLIYFLISGVIGLLILVGRILF